MHGENERRQEQLEVRLFRYPLTEIESAFRKNPSLARLWMIVHTDYADSTLTLARAAQIASVSKDHLNVLLSDACGLTFKQLLIRLRLLAAAQLLASEPHEPIEELSLRVGFGSVSSLQRQFRKHLGVTASAFRANPTL